VSCTGAGRDKLLRDDNGATLHVGQRLTDEQVLNSPVNKAVRLASYRQSWVRRESAKWLIEQCLPSLESLNFAGGGPLIIPQLPQALDLCIRSGRASQIDISFNTNLPLLPDRVTRYWPCVARQ